jgi:hypothetical protein
MPTRTQPRPRLCVEHLECRQLLSGTPLSPSFVAPMEGGTHGIYASFFSMTEEPGSFARIPAEANSEQVRGLFETMPSSSGMPWDRGMISPEYRGDAFGFFDSWGQFGLGRQGDFGQTYGLPIGGEFNDFAAGAGRSLAYYDVDGSPDISHSTVSIVKVYAEPIIVQSVSPPIAIVNSGVSVEYAATIAPPSRLADVSVRATVTTTATPAVIPISVDSSARPTSLIANASAIATAADRAAFLGQMAAVERRLTSEPLSTPLAMAVSSESNRDESTSSLLPRATGTEAIPENRLPNPELARRASEEARQEFASAPLPAPVGAGLLDGELPFGLAALDRAVRALTEGEIVGSGGLTVLVRCAVVSSGLLGVGLAWVMARRRPGLAAIALDDVGGLGEGLLDEEDPS